MFPSPRDVSLPALSVAPRIGPFLSIDPVILSRGASVLVGQVPQGLPTWLVFAALPTAGI